MRTPALALAALLLFAAARSDARQAPSTDQIMAVADASQCLKVDWPERGHAPKAYLRGMALVFARSLCEPEREDVKIASQPLTPPGPDADRDALVWYDRIFQSEGMANDKAGEDTLRHLYALMIGLGMRESSGLYCTGRDVNGRFNSAEGAEAGLFQTSWGVSRAHPLLPAMTRAYAADRRRCLLPVFSDKVGCPPEDWADTGEGDGADWQQLTKTCPAFAAEYAAVVLRKSGGGRGEFGTIRGYTVELRPQCDAMLAEVQALVKHEPGLCRALR